MAKKKTPEISVPKVNKEQKITPGNEPDAAEQVKKDPEIVADPSTGKAVKAKALTIFKSRENIKQPIYITDKRGERVKVYAHFKEGTLATADKEYISALQAIIDKYDEEGVDLIKRDILTEEQFLSLTSPEKLYVPYKGRQLHLTRVTEALEFAESKGWVPDFSEVLHVYTKKGKVRSGALSAGAAG